MNPLRPYKAVLRKIRPETADTNTYSLEAGKDFPGRVNPGQFTMLGYPGTGEVPVSFSGLPEDGLFEHTIRRVGTVTDFLNRMGVGDKLLVRGPYGNGWPLESVRGSDLLIVAGGVGLAPLRPVIREVITRRDSFGGVTLLYGARDEDSLLFTREYAEWGRSLSVHFTVDELVTVRPWPHSVGLITGLLDKTETSPERTTVFVCGPELMMRFVCRGLLLRGISSSRIYVSLERRMKCGIAQCGHCQHVGLFVCRDGPVFPYSRIMGLYDGLL